MNINNLQESIDSLRYNNNRNFIEQIKYDSPTEGILSDAFAQICNDYRESHAIAVKYVKIKLESLSYFKAYK